MSTERVGSVTSYGKQTIYAHQPPFRARADMLSRSWPVKFHSILHALRVLLPDSQKSNCQRHRLGSQIDWKENDEVAACPAALTDPGRRVRARGKWDEQDHGLDYAATLHTTDFRVTGRGHERIEQLFQNGCAERGRKFSPYNEKAPEQR